MMTEEQFVRAMGGAEKIKAKGWRVIECQCGHKCCEGWNVERIRTDADT